MESKEGIIEGWGPPEETDYDLRRRIKKEELTTGSGKKPSVEVPSKPKNPKVNKPTVPFDPHFQMDMIDDLMNSRGFSGFKRRRK